MKNLNDDADVMITHVNNKLCTYQLFEILLDGEKSMLFLNRVNVKRDIG